ncbi:hypothetical protein EF808_07085 [archaeon]|nr:MAG: hypothetical protein EF808_07085 [archaeon]
MNHYAIGKVIDNTLYLPKDVLSMMGINKDAYVLIEVDRHDKEAVVTRIGSADTELVEMNLILKNMPGTNAKIDTVLGDGNINILFGEGEAIDDETYISIKMLDMKRSDMTISELCTKLRETGVVYEVELKPLDKASACHHVEDF